MVELTVKKKWFNNYDVFAHHDSDIIVVLIMLVAYNRRKDLVEVNFPRGQQKSMI